MASIRGSSTRVLHALVITLVLSACAAQGEAGGGHAGHHRQGTAAARGPDGAPMMGGHSGETMGVGTGGPSGSRQTDMRAMCADHDQKSTTPAGQHGAMAGQPMQNMSPEMRERHMEMMRQHCK